MNEEKLKNFCKKYEMNFLAVFGSYAQGTAKVNSDLDLLVRFASAKSLLELVRIEREMSESLGIKVDLLTEKSISPYIKEKILDDLKVIYGNKR